MDRSECEALGRKHLGPLMNFLGVGEWLVTFKISRLEDDTDATCSRNLPYDLATVEFDPNQIKDVDHFLDVLAHELFHIVLAPFDLYRSHYCAALEPKSTEDKREDVLWANSVERTILNLERLWRRHMKALYLKTLEPPDGSPG